MKKIVKLKQSDLVKVVNKMISEQIGSTKPHVDDTLMHNDPSVDNPLSLITPSKFEKKPKFQTTEKRPAVSSDILNKKQSVRASLDKVLVNLGDLIHASGINPQTNNLVADIEKVKEKFENLFGDPTPETGDDE